MATLLLVGACAPEPGDTELLVSAAASLTDAFEDIAVTFEEEHPGVDILFNFAASSTLREQILQGAPGDVFASANMANMDPIVAAGENEVSPEVFATNRLAIAVPAGNPAGITGLEDFADEGLFIGLCAEGVPCGDFAREVLVNAGVTPSIDTNEGDVRALFTKIEAGELDAGITYVTDIEFAEGVEGIEIFEEVNVVAEYPIVVLTGANDPMVARAFVELVMSPEGQSVLVEHGFGAP